MKETELKIEGTSPQRIIVFRSFGSLLDGALETLQSKYPDAKIDILITKNDNQNNLKKKINGEVIQLPSSRFVPFNKPGQSPNSLPQRKYDLGLILYRSFQEENYRPVEKLLKQLNVACKYGLDRNQHLIPLTAWKFFALNLIRYLGQYISYLVYWKNKLLFQ